MKPKIYFKRVRDFGEVFGASFGYLTRNFKSFFGTILALAGPFFLLNSIASSFLLKFSFGNLGYGADPMQMLRDMAMPFFFVILLSILGSSVFNTVVNEHLLINEELGENERPSIGMIAKRFFGSYWRNLGVMFLTLVFSVIAYIIAALIIGVFIFLLKSIGFFGIFLIFLLVMFLILVILPIYVYIMVAIVFTSQRYKLNFFASTGRVFKYLKGNFWMTWLISFVGGLCTYIMIILAYLPVYVLMIVSLMTRVKMNDINSINNIQNDVPIYVTVITSVVGILIICISSLYVVMMNLQSASNEEKIEGTSILEKIESI